MYYFTIQLCSLYYGYKIHYCGVHDSSPMGPNRVRYVSDVDCVQMFVVAGLLNKDLGEKEKKQHSRGAICRDFSSKHSK